ncbi:carboxypeptidase regulatory-like domain-containing protein [Gimesia chilikensis]|uniref:carboxypeptidase regulatory-like domain-containing protein n=1 Tax=Gimesia chilikensis TaxID=2605989 RepID=UPI003A957B46
MAQWWQYILDLISGGPQASIIETVLRGALIFCILFVTIDWLTLWGTRWGNRHSMSKSFYLSLLIHFCLGLGWVTVVENSPAQPEPIVKSDPIAIRQISNDNTEPTPSDSSTLNDARLWQESITPLKPERNRTERDRLSADTVSLPRQIEPGQETSLLAENLALSPHTSAESKLPQAERAQTESSKQHSTPAPDVSTSPQDLPSAEARPESRPKTFSRAETARSPRPLSATGTVERQPLQRPSMNTDQGQPSPASPSVTDLSSTSEKLTLPAGKHLAARTPVTNLRKSTPAPISAPQVERPASMQPDDLLRGVVRDSQTGRPLAATTIRVDLPDGRSLVARTSQQGTYELKLSETPDNVAVSAARPGYLPQSQNLRVTGSSGKPRRLDFALRAKTERVIAIEENPVVHHLGDDQFEGKVNSQFQRPTEGATYRVRFEISARQYPNGIPRAAITLMAKGIQCRPQIHINGHLLTAGLKPSPDDGSFDRLVLPCNPNWLRLGENEITITSVKCQRDLDDFEFVNLLVWFAP